MQGYSFDIDYVAKRSRLKTLLAPFIILPLIFFLFFWSMPGAGSGVMNFIDNHLNFSDVHSKDELSSVMAEKINDKDIAIQEESFSFSEEVSFFLKDWFKIHYSYLNNNYDKNLVLIILFMLITISIWSSLILLLFNITYYFVIFGPVMVFMLFTKKYPNWIYNWNKEILSYTVRVQCYMLLLTTSFPSVEKSDELHITLPDPNGKKLNRALPLVKWILVLPHSIILSLITILIIPLSLVAYFTTIITGTYPKNIFNLIVGYMRWNYRVFSYSHLLVTDQYPQFGFKKDS